MENLADSDGHMYTLPITPHNLFSIKGVFDCVPNVGDFLRRLKPGDVVEFENRKYPKIHDTLRTKLPLLLNIYKHGVLLPGHNFNTISFVIVVRFDDCDIVSRYAGTTIGVKKATIVSIIENFRDQELIDRFIIDDGYIDTMWNLDNGKLFKKIENGDIDVPYFAIVPPELHEHVMFSMFISGHVDEFMSIYGNVLYNEISEILRITKLDFVKFLMISDHAPIYNELTEMFNFDEETGVKELNTLMKQLLYAELFHIAGKLLRWAITSLGIAGDQFKLITITKWRTLVADQKQWWNRWESKNNRFRMAYYSHNVIVGNWNYESFCYLLRRRTSEHYTKFSLCLLEKLTTLRTNPSLRAWKEVIEFT